MKDSIYALFDSTIRKMWEEVKTYPHILTIGLVSILLGLNVWDIFFATKSNPQVLSDLPVMSESALQEKVCYFGASSILKENISSQLFHPDTYKTLKANPDILELDNAEIIKVSVQNSVCRVVLKDEQGLRVFDLQVVKLPKLALGIGISNIDEQYLTKEDEE